MGRVLVAPGWEYDRQAIAEALRLLRPNDNYLLLAVQQHDDGIPVTVTPGPVVLPSVVTPDPDTVEQAERAAATQGLQYLKSVADSLQINAEIRVESGDPAERICATATQEEVDLIVIPSSNTNFVQRILGGSTSDQVAHRAPCPVLLVRGDKPEALPALDNR